MVLERLIRGFDSPRSETDDHNPVSLRYELGGLWVRSFHRFVSLLQHIRQSRVPAVRAGQRPVLARNDPLNIFGRQRQQTLLIAAAECRKKILHNLDILFDAHRNLSFSLTSSVSDLVGRSEPFFSGQITRWTIDYCFFLNKSWKMSRPQVRPRACTSAPPSSSFPSLTGANPSCLAKSATEAIASSSSLDKKTTRWPPSTTGSVARMAATR